MDIGTYDERVRSLINRRLRGMGKRLSSYCAAVVDGGDIDILSREFTEGMDGSVEDGIREAWAISEAMGLRMQEEARKRGAGGREAAYAAAMIIALQSFLTRKERVMNVEMAGDLARQTRKALGLLSGDVLKERARQLSEYIKKPARIVSDTVAKGEGRIERQPSLFSRMRKIMTTDIATAYRTAEYHIWQKLPFVVGQEIRLGRKHPVPDICDDLQGVYPKDFMFTGWHPFCRCFAHPIFSWEGDRVTDMPDSFTRWMDVNSDRIERAREKGTLPQWMYNNRKYVKLKNRELSEAVRARRKEIREEAQSLISHIFIHPEFKKEARISNTGIKEWINQPHKHYAEKNELLLKLKEVFPTTHYDGWIKGKNNPKIKVHLFGTEISGDKSWILVREHPNGQILFYSVSDSENITTGIIK